MADPVAIVPVAEVMPVINERRWERVLLVVSTFLTVCLLVVVTALEIQVQARNHDIRKVEQVAATAQAASERAEKAVNEAVAAGNKQSASIGPRFLQSLDTIETIKAELDKLLEAQGLTP